MAYGHHTESGAVFRSLGPFDYRAESGSGVRTLGPDGHAQDLGFPTPRTSRQTPVLSFARRVDGTPLCVRGKDKDKRGLGSTFHGGCDSRPVEVEAVSLCVTSEETFVDVSPSVFSTRRPVVLEGSVRVTGTLTGSGEYRPG